MDRIARDDAKVDEMPSPQVPTIRSDARAGVHAEVSEVAAGKPNRGDDQKQASFKVALPCDFIGLVGFPAAVGAYLEVNDLQAVSPEIVEAARDSLVIGQA